MKRVEDREHLDYVTKLLCYWSVNRSHKAQLPMEPSLSGLRPRISDPHHLPSLTGNRRRTCDWWVIPLARDRHNWIDTEEGRRWEKAELPKLYRYAAILLHKNNRITVTDMHSILNSSDEDLPDVIQRIEEGAHHQTDVERQKAQEPQSDETPFQDAVTLPNAIPKPQKRQSKWRR